MQETETETVLLKETQKMLEKLEAEMRHISYDSGNKDLKNEIENIRAYMSDCTHFMEKNDLVKAFEAIVFAWGIYETLLSMHHLRKHAKVQL